MSTLLAAAPAVAKPSVPGLRDRVIVTRSTRSAIAGWQASWDRQTGVAAQLWGGHVDAPGAVKDPAVAERAARQFIADHAALLAPGAQSTDFKLVANRLDRGIRTLGFAQTWRGVPVVGGQVGVVFQRDRLFAATSAAWPNVSTSLPAAKASAILPLVRAGSISYQAVTLDERDTEWRVYRDMAGREMARESRVMNAAATLEYNASVRYPGSTRENYPVSGADILVDSAAVTTAADGTFSWPGPDPATVIPSTTGTYVRVINQGGALVTTSLTVSPGDTAVWSLAGDEAGDAQLSTYIYANRAKDHARIVNPALAAWLDTRLDFYVNENGSCNAYSTGNDVHLYRGSTTCENTGRLADVVFHEFGHSVHNNSVIMGMGKFESHLSEGLADFFAADITGDSAVGRGIYLDPSPLRDIDPAGIEREYPLDVDYDPHVSGLIISGALWDMRKALIQQLGSTAGIARAELIFTGVMQRADSIGATFLAALIADDDDGDLSNRTPNYCAIETAFGRHGLVPAYSTTHVSNPVVDGLSLSMTVDVPAATTCAAPSVASITVTWQVGDDAASTFDLMASGTTWSGTFPTPPAATVVTYSVNVVYADGAQQRFPNNPADPRYQLFVGKTIPIACQNFDTNPAWLETNNGGFEWQWGPPVIGLAGGDPEAAFTGTNILGTDLTADGRYRPNLVTRVAMPVTSTARYEQVRLQYWRWLTVEDAFRDRATIRANHREVWRNATAETQTLDHVDREWRFHDIDITQLVDEGAVDIEWTLSSDITKELGGWNLDDVCVVGITRIPRCGDGELDSGEQCDDNNNVDADGCSAACAEEPDVIGSGDGGCCDAGTSAPNAGWLLALLLLRRRRRR